MDTPFFVPKHFCRMVSLHALDVQYTKIRNLKKFTRGRGIVDHAVCPKDMLVFDSPRVKPHTLYTLAYYLLIDTVHFAWMTVVTGKLVIQLSKYCQICV